MSVRSTILSLLLGVALVSAAPAYSHHSNVAFETQTIAEVQGTVIEWKWTNPHTWLHLAVEDGKGGTTEWAFEGRPPGLLSRVGWSPKTFKKGDKLTIHYSPAKDGTNTGLIARVTLADGTILPYTPPAVQ
jgi:hypothetical protein